MTRWPEGTVVSVPTRSGGRELVHVIYSEVAPLTKVFWGVQFQDGSRLGGKTAAPRLLESSEPVSEAKAAEYHERLAALRTLAVKGNDEALGKRAMQKARRDYETLLATRVEE